MAKITNKTSSTDKAPILSEEDRIGFMNEAAYYIAERRGFAPGDEVSDWLEAEKQFDSALAAMPPTEVMEEQSIPLPKKSNPTRDRKAVRTLYR